jgi:hypothetical protein
MPYIEKETITKLRNMGIPWGSDMCGDIKHTKIPSTGLVETCDEFFDKELMREDIRKNCVNQKHCELPNTMKYIKGPVDETKPCTSRKAYFYLQTQCKLLKKEKDEDGKD